MSDNSNNGYILGMWRYEIIEMRYGGFGAFLNDCVRSPEIMLSCGGKLWLVEIKDGVPAFTEAQLEWFSELREMERDGLWNEATRCHIMSAEATP